jgi:putative component of membrane protein insertase Oxa1/YidC/SpoIIIJ protein YidD
MSNFFLRRFVVKQPLSFLWLLPRRAAILGVTAYQHTLSPDHGPLKGLYTYGYCRHEPTCSVYAKEQLKRRGFVAGSVWAIARLLTCHPWRKISPEKMQAVLEKR